MKKEEIDRPRSEFKGPCQALFEFPPLFFALLLAWGCARTQPVDFKPGEYRCEFCQMDIVDLRFKAEILSPKGKIHRFDSIECMMGWARKHPEEVATRWVSDFYRPEQWIALEKAFFLKSDRLASPMGAFLSAYGTTEELNRALHENGGKALDQKALEDYIEQQWQKELKAPSKGFMDQSPQNWEMVSLVEPWSECTQVTVRLR